MKADEIAKLDTPLTDAEFDGLDNSGAELCRRLEQDRAALMEALEGLLIIRKRHDSISFAADTLAAVKEREAKHG